MTRFILAFIAQIWAWRAVAFDYDDTGGVDNMLLGPMGWTILIIAVIWLVCEAKRH